MPPAKIAMKSVKYMIILLLWSNIICCLAQNYVKYVPDYCDYDLISKMTDSLMKENVKVFFLYITKISENQINGTMNRTEMIGANYFIWRQKGKTHAVLITDSAIYKKLVLDTDGIFKYSGLDKVWLQEDENIYKFVCPIIFPDENHVVICITPKSKRYFELGENPVNYRLNPKRNSYRYKFISLLNNMLASTNNQWIKSSAYDRQRGWEEEN